MVSSDFCTSMSGIAAAQSLRVSKYPFRLDAIMPLPANRAFAWLAKRQVRDESQSQIVARPAGLEAFARSASSMYHVIINATMDVSTRRQSEVVVLAILFHRAKS